MKLSAVGGLLLLLLCIFGSSVGTKYLLSVPQTLYYDSNTTVTVSAFGVSLFDSVSLEFRGINNRSKVLNFTTMPFFKDDAQEWSIVFPRERILQLQEPGLELRMYKGNIEEKKELYFSSDFGHIFIQTDKPMYTPRDTVKFRVIAVDETEKLARYLLKIDVKNHNGIIYDRIRMTPEEAFKAQDFQIPPGASAGKWSITASFEGADPVPGSSRTVKFEVKEYVLPRFSTDVRVRPSVITRSTEMIDVWGNASYIYDRSVDGSFDIQFGTWDKDRGVELLKVHYTGTLKKGAFHMPVRVDDLFPLSKDLPENKRLYVSVNFTEKATLENDTFVDTNTFITNTDYVVDFSASKMYFKPNLNYTLRMKVLEQKENGTLADNTTVDIIAKFTLEHGKNPITQIRPILSNETGTQEFKVPENTESIHFTVKIPQNNKEFHHKVQKFGSQSKKYLQISLSTPIQKNKNGTLQLACSNTVDKHISDNGNISVTVLVLARGKVVYTTSVNKKFGGVSYVLLPSELYAQVTPRMRIVAYYYDRISSNPELVIDSIVVDTKPVCLEEVSFRYRFGELPFFKPKDKYSLLVKGEKDMLVGLVAVDDALLLLAKEEKEKMLDRASMFDQLGSHDKGTESGDGGNAEEVLTNSGLYMMSIEVPDPLTTTAMLEPHDNGVFFGYFMAQHNNLEEPQPSAIETSPRLTASFEHKQESAKESSSRAAEPPQQQERPQTKRREDFPESWMFTEFKLTKSWDTIHFTFPDSITKWKFVAVGLSANRGVCVSEPKEYKVEKLFYADIRLPYKAVRLEEVIVKITIYNHGNNNLVLKGLVNGDEGLCFVNDHSGDQKEKEFKFDLDIGPSQVKEVHVKVIPLRTGDLAIQAELKSDEQNESDTIVKKLHVIAEGMRLTKSITIVLDPEGKHVKAKPESKNKGSSFTSKSGTLTHIYERNNNNEITQHTRVDLDLPQEVISGTEQCRIMAFGDIIGDIIDHAIVKSKNLIDVTLMDAEEVLGDLAPGVYALMYANSSGLMDNKLKEMGRRFVRNGVARLAEYQQKDNSFALTKDSKPSTWLTAFALKTLHHASSFAFVDEARLIDNGFNWLVEQVNENKTLNELDWRTTSDSVEARTMLCAEVLIAVMESNRLEMESHRNLHGAMIHFLEDHLSKIKDPMVMAKVAYALMLDDDASPEYRHALRKLHSMKKENKQGQHYWSATVETNEIKRTPHWYRRGAQASAIEATAYALLIYLKHGDTDVDPIADWLIGQRNHRGTFVGALDSTVAIQALSEYSIHKHGVQVDLHCNVSSRKLKEQLLSFRFTKENATRPAYQDNVAVGQVLDVLTKGQGLGQMQINVEYNVPVEKNKRCPFKITVDPYRTRTTGPSQGNPLCAACDLGCEKPKALASMVKEGVDKENIKNKSVARLRVSLNPAIWKEMAKTQRNKRQARPPKGHNLCPRAAKPNPNKKPGAKKKLETQKISKPRSLSRSIRSSGTDSSSRTLCINVCLQRTKKQPSGSLEVSINMLTGYEPVSSDIEMIKKMQGVTGAEFDRSSGILKVKFREIACRKKTCIGFRVVNNQLVAKRLMPAIVTVRMGKEEPDCVSEYIPKIDETLKMYCADSNNNNRGECRCYNGLCSHCRPHVGDRHFDIGEIKNLVCKAAVVYQLQIIKNEIKDKLAEIQAKIISSNKTGVDNVKRGDLIMMATPEICQCPLQFFRNSEESLYMLSSDVESVVDTKNNKMFRYLLDKQTTFMRVSNSSSDVPWSFVKSGLNNETC